MLTIGVRNLSLDIDAAVDIADDRIHQSAITRDGEPYARRHCARRSICTALPIYAGGDRTQFAQRVALLQRLQIPDKPLLRKNAAINVS